MEDINFTTNTQKFFEELSQVSFRISTEFLLYFTEFFNPD